MIYYHYGNLKDATITEATTGSPTIDTQYPTANIKYLNKNLSTQFSVNGGGANELEIKIDMGSAVTASSIVLDYSANVSSATSNLVIVEYSDNNSSFTTIKTFKSGSGTHIYDGVETFTFTEITHRYYRLRCQAEDTTTANYVIRNFYIGDYLSLPSPELVTFGFNHKAKFSQAYGGSIFGVDTQGQREKWGFNFTNMKEADKTNWKAFDIVNKKGVVPCYMESIGGTTQLIDPYFVRVYGGENLKQSAFELYEMTNNVEEEL